MLKFINWNCICKIYKKKYRLNQASSKRTRKTHHVYVVELDKKVWRDNKKFRDANPQYMGLKCCLYVGMTSQSPKERFQKHKTGYRTKKGIKISSWYVEKYGLYLRPSLYSSYNPCFKKDATRLEKQLALDLRNRGYAVWWN